MLWHTSMTTLFLPLSKIIARWPSQDLKTIAWNSGHFILILSWMFYFLVALDFLSHMRLHCARLLQHALASDQNRSGECFVGRRLEPPAPQPVYCDNLTNEILSAAQLCPRRITPGVFISSFCATQYQIVQGSGTPDNFNVRTPTNLLSRSFFFFICNKEHNWNYAFPIELIHRMW